MGEEMKVQIIADGDPFNTKILDEDGNMMDHILRVKWEQDDHNLPQLHLTLVRDYALNLKGQPIYEVDLPTKKLAWIIIRRTIWPLYEAWLSAKNLVRIITKKIIKKIIRR